MATKNFGNFLKDLRKKRGLTQTQLAKLVGFSKAHINKMEKGLYKNPSINLLANLSQGLKTNIEDLLATSGLIERRKSSLLELDDYLKKKFDFSDKEIDNIVSYINFVRRESKKKAKPQKPPPKKASSKKEISLKKTKTTKE